MAAFRFQAFFSPAAGTDYCSCQVLRKNSCDPIESIEKKSTARDFTLAADFLVARDNYFLLQGMLRHPPQLLLCAWVQPHLIVRSQQPLRGQTKLSYPCQDFFAWRQPPRNIPAHKPCDVSLHTQAHQSIFGELLVGESLAYLFRQTPRP